MHPAIVLLLKAYSTARLRRLSHGVSSPRRILLSLFVFGLGFLWLGQTLASVVFRAPWDPDVFRSWVSLPLMMYFFWHVIRVAWKRSEQAIEWLPEEESLIVGGPFSNAQVLTYRMAVIFTATFPKALLTAFVLWPDLSWSGPLGILLALVFLEMMRLLMDLSVNCLSKTGYRLFRGAVVCVAGVAIYTGHQHAQQLLLESKVGDVIPVPIGQQAMAVVQSMRHGPITATVESPFLLAADVISGTGSAMALCGKLSLIIGALILMARLIHSLHKTCQANALSEERRLWKSGNDENKNKPRMPSATAFALPSAPLAKIFGPLVWRQSKRAWRFVGSLAISMGIPALMSCPPLLSIENSTVAFVFVVCGVLFYTFVLLPEAIKFDFRLDSDHLCQLRMLPITSTKLVLGQLATPVALASAFQVAVITFAGWYRDVGIVPVMCANAIIIPLTILFVAIDNLVFLLYPHRPTQEGFEAFLRAILKFTGKSLLLTLGAGALLLWAPTAAYLSSLTHAAVTTPAVFYGGVCIATSTAAMLCLKMVIRAYDQFDVSVS